MIILRLKRANLANLKEPGHIKGDSLCLKSRGGMETCSSYKLDGDKLVLNIMDYEMIYEK